MPNMMRNFDIVVRDWMPENTIMVVGQLSEEEQHLFDLRASLGGWGYERCLHEKCNLLTDSNKLFILRP